MGMTTAPSLLARLRNRSDALAWNQVVDLYTPLLLRWVGRLGVSTTDADDLVQEVWHAVTREMPEYTYDPKKGSFRGWLKAILLNRVRYHRRSRRSVVGSDQYDALADLLADDSSEASRKWDEEHDRYILTRLLDRVRDEFSTSSWKAFVGVAVEGRDAQTVADELTMTPNSVRIARCRVMARLRAEAITLGIES